ncbi:MAG: hypothetical protein FWE36_00435 [Erysipelotrichales bacterium]|nr:hypothetical protein [Erysipelotrichales bacterium]
MSKANPHTFEDYYMVSPQLQVVRGNNWWNQIILGALLIVAIASKGVLSHFFAVKKMALASKSVMIAKTTNKAILTKGKFSGKQILMLGSVDILTGMGSGFVTGGLTGEGDWDIDNALYGLRWGMVSGFASAVIGGLIPEPKTVTAMAFKFGGYTVATVGISATQQLINTGRVDRDKIMLAVFIGGIGGWISVQKIPRFEQVSNTVLLDLLKGSM